MNNKSNFRNSKGENKEIARNKIAEPIVKSDLKGGVILSLSFSTCAIEKKIYKKTNRFEFFGCDTDIEVIKEMRKTIVKHNLPFIGEEKCKLSKHIYSAKEDQYAHIIADYCGHFEKVAEEIEFAMEKRIVQVGGTIAITVERRANNHTNNIISEMEELEGKPFEKNKKIDQTMEAFLRAVGGRRYKIIENYPYHDYTENGNKSANMILMTVKRIK